MLQKIQMGGSNQKCAISVASGNFAQLLDVSKLCKQTCSLPDKSVSNTFMEFECMHF